MADSTLPFSLVPEDDVPPSPDDAVQAAVNAALGGLIDDTTENPVPLGVSWALDPQHGGFLRRGGREPVRVKGGGALVSWCQMAVYSERLAHRIFSDSFGVDGFAAATGQLPSQATAKTLSASLRRALLQHDRIASVENIKVLVDAERGLIGWESFSIVLDDESTILFGNIMIQVN